MSFAVRATFQTRYSASQPAVVPTGEFARLRPMFSPVNEVWLAPVLVASSSPLMKMRNTPSRQRAQRRHRDPIPPPAAPCPVSSAPSPLCSGAAAPTCRLGGGSGGGGGGGGESSAPSPGAGDG